MSRFSEILPSFGLSPRIGFQLKQGEWPRQAGVPGQFVLTDVAWQFKKLSPCQDLPWLLLLMAQAHKASSMLGMQRGVACILMG